MNGPNIVVLSEAGKPIFSRYGNEEDLSQVCCMAQALLDSARVVFPGGECDYDVDGDDDNVDDGFGIGQELRSIRAGRMLIVFLSAGSLTLMAVSDGGGETEAYLRMQLEYVYSQIVFTLTDQVQSIFRKNANFDLRNLLGATDDVMRGLLSMADPDADRSGGSFLTSAVETVAPLDPLARRRASSVLVSAGGGITNTLFAIMCVGSRLVSLVQPPRPDCMLRACDLRLILNFVSCQPGLLAHEAWLPLCLPRLDASGFVYAYTNCIDADTGLTVVFVSTINTTEQFELFRRGCESICVSLGLPPSSPRARNVIRASSITDAKSFEPSNPVKEEVNLTGSGIDDRRRAVQMDDGDIGPLQQLLGSNDGNGGGDGVAQSKYSSSNTREGIATAVSARSLFVDAVAEAMEEKSRRVLMSEYCKLASALHFVIRCDVPVFGAGNATTTSADSPSSLGKTCQCLSSTFQFPLVDRDSKRRVWNVYQRLALRLRNGSASPEATMAALDRTATQFVDASGGGYSADIGSSQSIREICQMQLFMENLPAMYGVTYLADGCELFIGLNGRGFEFYATLPSIVGAKNGTASCAKLVRRIMGADKEMLFLDQPLTWNA